MIVKLTGILDGVGSDYAVIDVNGVGYQAFCSARTLGRVGQPGGTVSLVIETFIREDRIVLYGFADTGERDWFRLLTTVPGVGARLGLAILGALDPESLTRAIAAQDKTALARADGVGPKLAARLINELKDKVGNLALGPAAATATARSVGGSAVVPAATVQADAVSALVNLGYGRSEAFGAVVEAGRRIGPEATVSDLIRLGLKELSS